MQKYITFIPYILVIVVFYLLVFVPESKRRKKYNQMLGGLKLNDEVMTKGGIIGKVVNIQDSFLIVQTGPDKIRIKIEKNGIADIMKASTNSAAEENKEDKKITK
ncbi:MAG: preprotein translocase subunit YajC [Bacillota bacterium]|nr:preprotein translocase subunit YajC [Bacillota bacterium]